MPPDLGRDHKLASLPLVYTLPLVYKNRGFSTSPTAQVLKLECVSESPRGLIKTETAGPGQSVLILQDPTQPDNSLK